MNRYPVRVLVVLVMWGSLSPPAYSGGDAHKSGTGGRDAAEGPRTQIVPQEMLSGMSPSLRAFCQPAKPRDGDADGIASEDLAEAMHNSAGWIRAVLQDEQVPEDVERRLVALMGGINGYDGTQAEFESSEFHFLVTQTNCAIAVVVIPLRNDARGSNRAADDVRSYMEDTIQAVFRYPKLILHICSDVVDSPSGVGMRPRADLRKTKESEQLERELRKLDPTLPKCLGAGPLHYWWAKARAVTDGRVLVFSTSKANGGGAWAGLVSDWFRKEELLPRGRQKLRAPQPPEGRRPSIPPSR